MQLKNKFLAVGCMAIATVPLVIGSACNEHEIEPFAKSLSSGKKQSTSSGSARKVDILFVVDDSSSMREEQKSLDANFGTFLKKLDEAGADYRLATVSTSWNGTATMPFVTTALDTGKDVLMSAPAEGDTNEVITEEMVNQIKEDCQKYFSGGGQNKSKKAKGWIDSTDFDSYDEIKNMFRCEAILGIHGSATEKGLATMRSALAGSRDIKDISDIDSNFKRPGSILTIVFVTDENDCSALSGTNLELHACENQRNITDSCAMTREDRVRADTSNPDITSSELVLSEGQILTYNDKQKTLREWCVQGDQEAAEALHDCLDRGDDCSASPYILCPPDEEGKANCADKLEPRKAFYDFLIDYVSASNEAFYYAENTSSFATLTTAQEHKDLLTSMAKSDIIIASIINRDQGVRYNQKLAENWCGIGTQGYRYQLFAEMFDNDPIYAPICCKNEEFSAESKGDVCDAKAKIGENGKFGPVLAAIGKRIGEAVNTLCADAVPVTCEPAQCTGNSKSCPCLHGCSEQGYFANTPNEYHVCNEFQFLVGTINKDGTGYNQYKEGSEYTINYESAYCKTRTGAPIQINMIKTEAGKELVFEYPKQTTGGN